jgi:hypothetical protein
MTASRCSHRGYRCLPITGTCGEADGGECTVAIGGPVYLPSGGATDREKIQARPVHTIEPSSCYSCFAFMPLRLLRPAGWRGFPRCWLARVRCQKSGRDEDAAELGEHVRGRRLGLRRVPRGAGTVVVDVGGVVAGGGVPDGGHGLAGELERDGALDRAGGAVAGLPCSEDLLTFCYLAAEPTSPPGGEAFLDPAIDEVITSLQRSAPLSALAHIAAQGMSLGHMQWLAPSPLDPVRLPQ